MFVNIVDIAKTTYNNIILYYIMLQSLTPQSYTTKNATVNKTRKLYSKYDIYYYYVFKCILLYSINHKF
jgi:hypothetical protein